MGKPLNSSDAPRKFGVKNPGGRALLMEAHEEAEDQRCTGRLRIREADNQRDTTTIFDEDDRFLCL